MRFLESISDAILNRSPEELIGALLIAAAVAIVVAGLYGSAAGSRVPLRPSSAAWASPPVPCAWPWPRAISSAARTNWNSGSAANYGAPQRWPQAALEIGPRRRLGASRGGLVVGFHVVVAADENRDGRLTPEEVARLVRKADTDGDGWSTSRDRPPDCKAASGPPSQPSSLTAAGPNDRGGREGPRRERSWCRVLGRDEPWGSLDE